MEYDFTKDIDYVAYEDFLRKYSLTMLPMKIFYVNTPGIIYNSRRGLLSSTES